MARILTGKEVAEALNARKAADVEKLKLRGIIPTLCIFRVGSRADDISYEKGAMKRAAKIGVAVKQIILPEDVREDVFEAELKKANEDPLIHGILLFRPLPPQLDGEKARRMLNPAKDIDGSTDISQAGVFTGSQSGFPPCTAEAVMEMLRFYGIDPAGKSAVVIGRSLVIGRPVAMMLMQKNATVTICHTRTQDTAAIAKKADILVTATGKLRSVTPAFAGPEQVIIDVGIAWDEEKGRIAGDVDFDKVEPLVGAVSPVPGGVGAVTTSVLIGHVVEAAMKMSRYRAEQFAVFDEE